MASVLQVSSHASVLGEEARREYVRVVDAMGQKLRAARYNGAYFDRSAKAGGRLCTPEGWFSCQVSRALSRGRLSSRVTVTTEGQSARGVGPLGSRPDRPETCIADRFWATLLLMPGDFTAHVGGEDSCPRSGPSPWPKRRGRLLPGASEKPALPRALQTARCARLCRSWHFGHYLA